MPGSDSAAWVSRRVLDRVAKFIAALEDEDVEALVAGRAKLKLEYRGVGGSRPRARELDIEEVLKRLRQQTSREAVTELLEHEGLTRLQLIDVARSLKTSVQKQDSVGRIRERIAEAVIGFQLRSDAILGVDPSSKRDPKDLKSE
jgi:hypothetical protein